MRRMLCIAALAALGIASCGGDDGGGEGDLAAYCDLVEETQSSADLPTAGELDEYRDVAPDEISEQVDTLADAFEDLDDPDDLDALLEAFEEPEVAEAIEEIEAFDAENCGNGADASGTEDEETTPTSSDEEDDEAGGDDDSTTTASSDDEGTEDEGATGTLCEDITDEEVSDVVGVDLSSADTLFNNEESCNYESEDGQARLFIGRTPDLDQPESFFQQTAEDNFDDYEELDGIGDSAYFVTSEVSGATVAALADGFVHTVILDAGDDDPLAHRDAAIELLELLLAT